MSVYDTVTTDIAALGTAIAAVTANGGRIAGAAPLVLAPAVLAAQTANSAIDAAIASNDALIDTSGVVGIAAGVFAPTLAALLLAQNQAFANEVILMTQKGAVGRILVNLGIAPG